MPEAVAIVPLRRSIGGIVAQVTIRENMRDDMVVTEHPVENGANISDHAYKRPSEVELEIGWGGTYGNPSDFYNNLLALQAQRQPVNIVTGKRSYANMLPTNIAVVTDQRTEFSLIALIRFRQINLVSTQSTVISPTQGNQTTPQATQQQASTGTTSLKPAPQYKPLSGAFPSGTPILDKLGGSSQNSILGSTPPAPGGFVNAPSGFSSGLQ